MLVPITVLLTFQLIGEVIAQALRLPIPGPVVGMGLFFAALALPRVPAGRMREPAQQLLQHLSLLFVPAGVGVMLHYRASRRNGCRSLLRLRSVRYSR